MPACELLSPCGSRESLEAALRFGADAVYMGGPLLQMRAASAGFSLEALQSAVHYAHDRGKKVYVTVNTLLKNGETEALSDYGQALAAMGADGAIVSDIGAIRILRRVVPELPLHLSTQCSVMNYEAAMAYFDMGIRRLVLAREMTLEDIAALHTRIPKELELEAFVHGAMCMAYSGRCLLSSFILGRSGNRGACAQPCRLPYGVNGPCRGAYPLSLKDANLSAYLQKLRDMTRADDEQTQLSLSTFDLKPVVEKLIRLQHAPEGKQVSFETHFTDNLLVTADPVHMANIISNLMENAVKYSGSSVSIRVECRLHGHELTLKVSDDGIGIPVSEQGRVFDKFYRSSNLPDRSLPGIGLGLSYVKLLVEAHRGTVFLTSQIGRGTTVEITIPQ